MRFWTYWSNLLKGFFNISKKMAVLIFLKSLWVHLHDVHGLIFKSDFDGAGRVVNYQTKK